MSTKEIRKGQILAPVDNGMQIDFMALTKQSSATIEGETLENLVYLATGKELWNPKESVKPIIRINGIVSGCNVIGGSSNDNLELEAGIVNVNGKVVTVAADISNAITRGATETYAVHALCVDDSGVLSVVAGADGASLDLTGGYGGAGQKPLIATNLVVLRYAVTYGDTAAPISSEDIYMGESANISHRIDHVRGGVILYEAQEANHTGSIPRGIYASFYELAGSSLQAIGKIEEASVTFVKGSPFETPNMDSNWKDFTPNREMDWKATVKKWRVDQFWVDQMLDPNSDFFILKMKETASDTYRFQGVALLHGDYNLLIKRGPVSESLSFQGTGELRRITE